MGRLANRTAIVTGAGLGIGKGIARRLAAEGAAVVIAEYNEAAGQAAAEEIRRDFGANGAKALALTVDVRDKVQVLSMVDAVVKAFGTVDILVNNAWASRPGGKNMSPVEAKVDEDLDHAFKIGYMSAFWAMQAVFPLMKERQWGRIINLASLNGVNAHPYTLEYNSAKEALRALTRTAAREWAQHQICCNIICPGAATEAYKKFAAAQPENAAQMLKLNPMGRMGDPEFDIGSVALFLASDDARYLTGNTLFVDGGSHINGVPWMAGGT
ncbi:oxidoreductase [Denitratisoma sp. DHT3]|uniref:SDR family NAD(P)-dependent oxidoreductase n=1 Tax=Denitratisoma sp. DHT3 TaxID=1981880 RepID=UPI00119836DB|nr:SDR family oxidoreductase [Denitratisoma sp. DHT3]QDX80039.1 oxidoreductase [Denitratisoma sp. DHT3]